MTPERGRIVIELTEHAPIEDFDALGEAIRGLRARGACLAIDDAGAGFSSLGNILRLSPDYIKLDISVIRGIDRDEARREAVAALRRFAADIGSAIVAEGIETAAQLQALRALGIPYGQGFYLARPARLTPGGRVPTRIRPS